MAQRGLGAEDSPSKGRGSKGFSRSGGRANGLHSKVSAGRPNDKHPTPKDGINSKKVGRQILAHLFPNLFADCLSIFIGWKGLRSQ